jgi:hypothetical protein
MTLDQILLSLTYAASLLTSEQRKQMTFESAMRLIRIRVGGLGKLPKIGGK